MVLRKTGHFNIHLPCFIRHLPFCKICVFSDKKTTISEAFLPTAFIVFLRRDFFGLKKQSKRGGHVRARASLYTHPPQYFSKTHGLS